MRLSLDGFLPTGNASLKPPKEESKSDKNTVYVESENKICGKSKPSDVKVLSSTDNPYVISDALRKALRKTKKSLLICAPWFGKIFVDLVRNLVPKGVVIKLLAKRPSEIDRTHIALDTFTQIGNSDGYKINIKCKSYLHAKFMVIDDTVVLSGSFNPTDSGIYYNDELLYVITNPEHIEHHVRIFDRLWKDPRNTSWQKFQQYTGLDGFTGDYYLRKTIAERIERHFDENGNREVKKSLLAGHIARQGFDKDLVIGIIKNLKDDGVLYEPRDDFLKMAKDG